MQIVGGSCDLQSINLDLYSSPVVMFVFTCPAVELGVSSWRGVGIRFAYIFSRFFISSSDGDQAAMAGNLHLKSLYS